jgi:beta-lactam-binding protein with PASTA domain
MAESSDLSSGQEGASSPPSGPRRWGLWVALGVGVAALVLFFAWRAANTVEVPDVVGLSQAEATVAVEAAGLSVGRVSAEETLAAPPETVTGQSPAADSQAPKGSSIDLTVAAIPVVNVPDVVGKPESEAEAALAAEGLRTGTVTGEYSAEAKAGVVLAQSPEANKDVTVGSLVSLAISLGPEKGAVPDIVGLTITDAEQVLQTAGFESNEEKKTSEDVDAGVVISQSPSAGTVTQTGSTVALVVSSGPPAEAAAPEPESPAPSAPEPPAPSEPQPQPEPEPPAPEPAPETAQVPDIVGMRILEAIGALRSADLGFDIAWGPTADQVLLVIDQDPGAGSEVDPGTSVTVTIGLPEFLFDDAQVEPPIAEPPGTEEGTRGDAPTTTPAP